MQPLRRELRSALKRAHPGLEDRTIDEVESLLARRFQLDPERHQDLIDELDRQRTRIIQEKMPHYAWVVQVVRRTRESGVPRPRIGPPSEPPAGKASPKAQASRDAQTTPKRAGRRSSRRPVRRPPASSS